MIRPIDPGENPAVTGDQGTRIEGVERYERPAPDRVERVERVERYEAPERRPERVSEAVGAAGAGVLAFAGAVALVLSIIGLAGFYPESLLAIGVLCLAGALFVKGSANAARMPVPEAFPGASVFSLFDLGLGTTIELVGGAGGVVLGILALCKIIPTTLLSISAIVIGATLVFATTRPGHAWGSDKMREAMRVGLTSAIGLQVFAGAGAITLGILALNGYYPLTLALVSFLAMGAAALLVGLAAGGQLSAMLARRRQRHDHEPART
jgi:hypothetical protein